MSTITFLGTGGDITVVGKGQRSAGGILIENGRVQLHIDPGPGSLQALRQAGKSPRATTALLITSPLLLQSNDINAVIAAMTLEGQDIHGVVIAPKIIIDGDEKVHLLLFPQTKAWVERIIIAEEGKKVGVETIDMEWLKTHQQDYNLGLKLYLPDMTLGYSSVTQYLERIGEQYEGCDVIIMHVITPSTHQSKQGMNTEDIVRFINRAKPKLTILTGFGKEFIENDPIQIARDIHKKTGCQVMAAVDGQSISPMSYSAKSAQKRLNTY